MNLLITSAESRKCFDIFNILRSKIDCIYLCSDLGIIRRSFLAIVYLKRIYKKEKILRKIKIQTLKIKIFPVEESDLESIYSLNLEFASVMPNKKAYYSMVNKNLLFELAKESNLPCPLTSIANELEINSIKGKLVVKPFRGMGSEGVRFFENQENAIHFIKSLPRCDDMLVQELIGNNNVRAGCFLFFEGDLISFYGHERIRTYPEAGGVTVCSLSHQDKRIMDLGKNLLGPLNWSGLAMIEFMWSDQLNDYQLIEVNPRAWGSIMLSEKCDSNMLMSYVNLIFEKPVKQSIGKKNCSIRWPIPYDIINFIKGKIQISDYTAMDRKKDCLINISYSNLFQSGLFHAFQFTQFKKIFKRFFSND